MGFSPERSGGSWSDVVGSEQRNDRLTVKGKHRSSQSVVSARSANHITERQAHAAGRKLGACGLLINRRKLYSARTLAIKSSIASLTIALILPTPPRIRSSRANCFSSSYWS